jgi:hypothetical protein
MSSATSALWSTLPIDIVNVILTYLPKHRKQKPKISPSLQKHLEKIQSMTLKGKSATYLIGLDDFCLD